jgi:hypothetical protein
MEQLGQWTCTIPQLARRILGTRGRDRCSMTYRHRPILRVWRPTANAGYIAWCAAYCDVRLAFYLHFPRPKKFRRYCDVCPSLAMLGIGGVSRMPMAMPVSEPKLLIPMVLPSRSDMAMPGAGYGDLLHCITSLGLCHEHWAPKSDRSEVRLVRDRDIVVEQMLVVLGAYLFEHGLLHTPVLPHGRPGLIEGIRIVHRVDHL